MTSPFAQALLQNTRPLAVMHGLLKRRPTFFSSPSWIADANKTPTLAMKLTNLALKIAPLLRKADDLHMSTRPKQAHTVSLLTQLTRLERDVQVWLLRFYTLTTAGQSPYRLVSASQYSSFEDRCGGLAHVIRSVIEFPSFLSATTHAYVWMCLLVLRQTILVVARLHPYPLVRPKNQEVSLLSGADECALNLCQSIAYLSRPEHASCGIVACGGPLHFASGWFKQQENLHGLLWSRHVREFLQRDVLLGGSYDTSLDLSRPVLVWWMLPKIPD